MKPRHSTSVGSSAITEVSDIYLTFRISLVRVLFVSFPLCTLCALWRYRLPFRDDGLMRKREREIERPSSAYDSGNDESSPTSKSVPIVSTHDVLAKGKCHYHTFSTMYFAVGRLALRIPYTLRHTRLPFSFYLLILSLSLFLSDKCIPNIGTK